MGRHGERFLWVTARPYKGGKGRASIGPPRQYSSPERRYSWLMDWPEFRPNRCFFAAVRKRPLLVEPRQQARGVPAPAAHRLHVGIELVDQRGERQLCTVGPGLLEHDAEVLAHPVDGKAEIVLAGEHGLVTVFHLPR